MFGSERTWEIQFLSFFLEGQLGLGISRKVLFTKLFRENGYPVDIWSTILSMERLNSKVGLHFLGKGTTLWGGTTFGENGRCQGPTFS